MLVSVCIPTHERREMLAEALRSVLSQATEDVEIVVSDNASADGTADMVAALGDPRVRLLRQERDVGSVENHNACVRAARGTWILFLHDDDLLLPGGLRRVAELVRSREACDILLPAYLSGLLEGNVFDNCLRLLNGISPSSTLFRRALLLRFPFEPDNVCCDWEVLFLAALRGSRLCTYPFAYVERRHHGGQEGTAAARDGRGVLGKSHAMARLCALLGDAEWDALCGRVGSTWTEAELMTLGRFVRNGGHPRRFRTLVERCRAERRWRWASRRGALIAVEALLGPALASRLLRPWRGWNHARRRR